jgi:hypothetical protein
MIPLTRDPILLRVLDGKSHGPPRAPDPAAMLAECNAALRCDIARLLTELNSARRVIELAAVLMPELPAAHASRMRDCLDEHAVIALACRRDW